MLHFNALFVSADCFFDGAGQSNLTSADSALFTGQGGGLLISAGSSAATVRKALACTATVRIASSHFASNGGYVGAIALDFNALLDATRIFHKRALIELD